MLSDLYLTVPWSPADGDCYAIGLNAIYKHDNRTGSWSQVGAGFSSSPKSGDTIKLTASGKTTKTLELFINDISRGRRSDSYSAKIR